jgi:hypothetical protein
MLKNLVVRGRRRELEMLIELGVDLSHSSYWMCGYPSPLWGRTPRPVGRQSERLHPAEPDAAA